MKLSGVQWRETARRTKFAWVLDAQVLPFFFLLVVHFRLWTLQAVVLVVLFFSVLGWFGYPLPVFLRRVRRLLAGKRRSARPWWFWKRFTTRVI